MKATTLQVHLSFCLRVRSNEIYCKINRVYLVRFIVRDLKPKLFFKCHNDLNCVQTIQPEIILKVSIWCNLQ